MRKIAITASLAAVVLFPAVAGALVAMPSVPREVAVGEADLIVVAKVTAQGKAAEQEVVLPGAAEARKGHYCTYTVAVTSRIGRGGVAKTELPKSLTILAAAAPPPEKVRKPAPPKPAPGGGVVVGVPQLPPRPRMVFVPRLRIGESYILILRQLPASKGYYLGSEQQYWERATPQAINGTQGLVHRRRHQLFGHPPLEHPSDRINAGVDQLSAQVLELDHVFADELEGLGAEVAGERVGVQRSERSQSVGNVLVLAGRLPILHVVSLGELQVPHHQLAHEDVGQAIGRRQLDVGDAAGQVFGDKLPVLVEARLVFVGTEVVGLAVEGRTTLAGGLVQAVLWDGGFAGHGVSPKTPKRTLVVLPKFQGLQVTLPDAGRFT